MVIKLGILLLEIDLAEFLAVFQRQAVHPVCQGMKMIDEIIVDLLVLAVILLDPELLVLDPGTVGSMPVLPALVPFYIFKPMTHCVSVKV